MRELRGDEMRVETHCLPKRRQKKTSLRCMWLKIKWSVNIFMMPLLNT